MGDVPQSSAMNVSRRISTFGRAKTQGNPDCQSRVTARTDAGLKKAKADRRTIEEVVLDGAKRSILLARIKQAKKKQAAEGKKFKENKKVLMAKIMKKEAENEALEAKLEKVDVLRKLEQATEQQTPLLRKVVTQLEETGDSMTIINQALLPHRQYLPVEGVEPSQLTSLEGLTALKQLMDTLAQVDAAKVKEEKAECDALADALCTVEAKVNKCEDVYKQAVDAAFEEAKAYVGNYTLPAG